MNVLSSQTFGLNFIFHDSTEVMKQQPRIMVTPSAKPILSHLVQTWLSSGSSASPANPKKDVSRICKLKLINFLIAARLNTKIKK